MSSTQDPLHKFHQQFQSFVQNNPNVISAARAASQIPESAKAVVVLSPLSLQHVFLRDWVAKSYKKTIVERPERLLASSMGISAAITMYPALFTLKSSSQRLGSLNAPHVVKIHGTKWPNEIVKLCQKADEKLAKGEIEVPASWNAGDIYLSSRTIEALQGSIGALETGVDSIFSGPSPDHISNRAFVAIRPPGHHCHVDTPSGFCLLNNAHIAIEYASDTYGITHAVILDFDLHHGDGTQDICWKRAGFRTEAEPETTEGYDEFGKKFAEFPKVGYFSMHDINSFPTESQYATKENIRNASTCVMNAHDVNIWNIHLSPWETEQDFDKLYQTKYRTLFAKADEFFRNAKEEMDALGKPFQGLVVISAGFDASEFEQTSMQRHSVNVPTHFYTMFTKDALKLSQIHCHGKVLSIMEGGYSDKAIASGVFSHLIGLQNQNWIKEWGSEQVVKEIVRGCKPHWKPYKTKKSRDVIRIWAEEVIKLGRSMINEFEDVLFHEKETEVNDKYGYPSLKPQRVTRSQTNELNHIKMESEHVPPSRKSERESRKKTEGHEAKQHVPKEAAKEVPFVEQELFSDEEDEEYIYDEELNKTFNRTVEDITIDDISRHLETLEIVENNHDEDEDDDNGGRHKNGTKKLSNSDRRIPSSTTSRNIRVNRNSNILNFDDSDISMISHVGTTRKHSTRSGGRW
ncbi:hypothetical protein Kpol_479p6 [Vanderwaltozyma polyspora DSM 70294]|uniref:Histone deacetylase domain-containing protein n=1 Tax=Vanderwaltozyma polyspora (strain ATCC 22028 / DSM 70294 / BCRC 21397 / CBS 2163 / NBRC 10782 / NRRL Y-8283 / UCD 57-17) TaxID=436907 RepID=A7TQB9_VANPO|nr:uncharacterized protein Kpol_479p6 [Vanderwaltozyma polyspora DSM 70294]EDO15518.1 hypothetical protein Kpol_479p6 [Vanderwaltozyma polyspora DSM 70294]